jgi:hypothetical protein
MQVPPGELGDLPDDPDCLILIVDLDIDLLNFVGSKHFALTHFGRYLQQLRAYTPGPIVADMFCLLRLELELAVQAKALLMAREAVSTCRPMTIWKRFWPSAATCSDRSASSGCWP